MARDDITCPRRSRCRLLLLVALVASPLSAIAQSGSDDATGKTSWSAEVGAGIEYDTNVTVDEVDISSGQSDYAGVLELDLGVKHAVTERVQASINYSVTNSDYQTFSRVDRLTQILGSDLSVDLGKGTAGISAFYIDSRLDGDGFLEYLRLSPYVSGFLSQRWFARTAFVRSERRIDNRAVRNADTNTLEADFYYFHRGLRSYFNIGYRYRQENAVADELDFDGHALKLRYIYRWDLFGRRAKSEIALRFEDRDYSSDEPTIGEPRQDRRLRWKVDTEVPLTKRLGLQVYGSYGDYTSNLPRADFTQTILGTRLLYRW